MLCHKYNLIILYLYYNFKLVMNLKRIQTVTSILRDNVYFNGII